MRESLRKESRVIALAFAIGLGGTACGGKSPASESENSIVGVKSAVVTEPKSATIKYFGDNRRQVIITPQNLIFEETCHDRDMYILWIDGATKEQAGPVIVEDARECKDNRITPKDFKEELTLMSDYPS